MYKFIQVCIVFMICESFSVISLQASSRQFPLTAEELYARKERQAMIAARELVKIEVGTFVSLCNQIDQVFIYEQPVYKNIKLKDFYAMFAYVVHDCKEDAQSFSSLEDEESFTIYNELKVNEMQRKIDNYVIVGEMPIIEFDKNGMNLSDKLFNISNAKEYTMNMVKDYIDNNYKKVCAKCCPQPQKDSKKVLSVPCCTSQFHEKCLLSCKNYNIRSCPNPKCQIAENGTHYSKTWNNDFYDEVLRSQSLFRKEIAAGTCMLCEELLKTDISVSSMLKTLRKRVDKDSIDSQRYKK